MEQSLLIHMEKERHFWRMDVDNYQRFISYLRYYFTEDVLPFDAVPHKIIYADVEQNDLCIICPLFGISSYSREKLVLKELFPKRYIVKWEDTFKVRLCIETQNGFFFFLLRMKIKGSILFMNDRL